MANDAKVDVKVSQELKSRILDTIAQEIERGETHPETLYHKGSFLQGHGKSLPRT